MTLNSSGVRDIARGLHIGQKEKELTQLLIELRQVSLIWAIA